MTHACPPWIGFRSTLSALLVCAASVLACADAPVAPVDATRIAAGTWGGSGAGVIVTDSALHVHIGCSFGDVLGVVALNANGTFSSDGSYMPRAYPIAIGPAVPARFSGKVQGRALTITVIVNDTVTKMERVYGPVVVTYDREPQLGPCPICRVPGMTAPAKPGLLSRLRRYLATSMSQAHRP